MIAEVDRFVKRKIRKRRRKALTAENYGGTLFHGENMPSNRITNIGWYQADNSSTRQAPGAFRYADHAAE